MLNRTGGLVGMILKKEKITPQKYASANKKCTKVAPKLSESGLRERGLRHLPSEGVKMVCDLG